MYCDDVEVEVEVEEDRSRLQAGQRLEELGESNQRDKQGEQKTCEQLVTRAFREQREWHIKHELCGKCLRKV